MSDTVIRVENLSKKYIIRHQQAQQYTALRDVIADGVKSIGRRLSGAKRDPSMVSTQEEFWALKDVSFEVKQGEVVGIIGHNGAGKSTLLKILSQITEPTTGQISINGRVASLLEVGTGFHPELTGRENIYLNGAILGMNKEEIKKKFNEIVEFAEVEQFLDTPVKHYSSGMYVRLAFSVAAYLEPEILVIDEVLAVGDAAFQKKCLEKMGDVSRREGRTLLFISHQMAAIQNLCQRVILLGSGKIICEGETHAVIERYLKESATQPQVSLLSRNDRKGTGDVCFISVILQNDKGETITLVQSGQNVILKFFYKKKINKHIKNLHFSVGIDNQLGERITLLSNEVTQDIFQDIPSNISCIEIYIKKLPLVPGRYGLTIYCTANDLVSDWIQNAAFFDVESGNFFGSGKLPPAGQGNFLVDHYFKLSSEIICTK
jgi:lipopolysaccharide transport system ATP-binding protein